MPIYGVQIDTKAFYQVTVRAVDEDDAAVKALDIWNKSENQRLFLVDEGEEPSLYSPMTANGRPNRKSTARRSEKMKTLRLIAILAMMATSQSAHAQWWGDDGHEQHDEHDFL